MSALARKQENHGGLFQKAIEKMKKNIQCYKQYKSTLGQHEAGVRTYIKEEVERLKKRADKWGQRNLDHYTSVQRQVGNVHNIQFS